MVGTPIAAPGQYGFNLSGQPYVIYQQPTFTTGAPYGTNVPNPMTQVSPGGY